MVLSLPEQCAHGALKCDRDKPGFRAWLRGLCEMLSVRDVHLSRDLTDMTPRDLDLQATLGPGQVQSAHDLVSPRNHSVVLLSLEAL